MTSTSCPKCHQKVDAQATTCPYCRTELKAFGHPGIPLHRAIGNEYLCQSCTYDADDSCNFPQRPYAKECTLYQNIEESKLELQQQRYKASKSVTFKSWFKQNQAWLLLMAFVLICLAIALTTS